MRKYYQLLLLLMCCFSVGVLLMYKSENNRLKYVLQAVNFFGRKDASILMRLENVTKADDMYNPELPLPVWWSIGDAFHAYAAYWNRNELVAGGEAFALVVGKRGGIVSYKCSILFDKGKTINGRFKFQRILEDDTKDFTTYWFFCKLSRDFGSPTSVVFSETSMKEGNEIMLHHIKAKPNKPLISQQPITICVDMVNFNVSSKFFSEANLLQFFLYHQDIGINKFFVYKGDALPMKLHQLLYKTSLQIHYFPFNFPFGRNNASANIRQIIENDCIVRNANSARYTLLLSPNEFFYPIVKLNADGTILRSLDKYSTEVTHFEIPSFAVCLDNDKNKLLMDNKLYDPEMKFPNKLFIHRPLANYLISSLTGLQAESRNKEHSISLSLSKALAHRYIECIKIGSDGLYDWRTSLREDFIQQMQALHSDMSFII